MAFSTQAALGEPVQTLTLQRGNISALLRDNALSPGLLGGVDSLFNRVDAPDFDAFDPAERGASAGLNFEHVICGHSNAFNSFTPRRGRYELFKLADGRSAMLVATGIFGSRLVGLIRSRVITHYFGLGAVADAWSAAFRIPRQRTSTPQERRDAAR